MLFHYKPFNQSISFVQCRFISHRKKFVFHAHRQFLPVHKRFPLPTAKHPLPPKKINGLEFLWTRKDPVTLPKTIGRQLSDGSQFHSFVKRKNAYELLKDQLDEGKLKLTPEEIERVSEKLLPPIVYSRKTGKYAERELSNEDKEKMKLLRSQKMFVREIAENLQCSIAQVVKEVGLPKKKVYSRRRKWYFFKRYGHENTASQ